MNNNKLTKTKRTPSRTAEKAYAEAAANFAELVRRLAPAQAALAEGFASNGARDWSYAGSLEEANKRLAEVLAMLGDRTAVDELGVTY